VNNQLGLDERYKDVVHEDTVKVGGSTRAPDYSFRIGGMRKFFVEAKKPALNLKEDPEPAYQVRRYAWSAKLPVSILTDFEEFIVYDCTAKPSPKDPASKHRIGYYTYRDYIEKWDEIAAIFSKQGILTGGVRRLRPGAAAEEGREGHDRYRRRLPHRDRGLAGDAGEEHRAQKQGSLGAGTECGGAEDD
jgi:hypothetical protein